MSPVGALLREWRRHRHLSQLDLANSAEVSARHVSLVETGRSKPSAAMILRLAEQLDVPLRERNRLLQAGGFAAHYSELPLDGGGLSRARDALQRVLSGHEPYPAVALDRRWNVVLANRAVSPFLADLPVEVLTPRLNLVRLGLDQRALSRNIVNLAEVRAVFRRRISRQLAVAPDSELRALYDEYLAAGQDETIAPGDETDIAVPMILRFGGHVLRLFSTVTTFGTPMDVTLAEVAVESYHPDDAVTEAYFTMTGR